MELLASFVKDLICILLTAAHTLKLGEVLARWEHLFQTDMLLLECLELCTDVLEGQAPLLLQVVVLLEAGAHVSLVVLVMLRDLRLPLLEDLDLETSLPGPLLAQVLVKLLN